MATVTRPLATKPAPKLNSKTILWGVMFVMAMAIFVAVDIPFLDPHHPHRAYQYMIRWVLVPHIIFGIVAMIAGPIQFSTRVRRRYPQFHRILGRVYVVSILIAAPMGILIPIVGPLDGFFSVGVMVHGAVWFICTLMAFLTARNRHIPQHRQWMVRSYVLTFSFILSRVLGPIWALLHVTITQYGMIDVILNVLYILIADIALNWREITTRRA